MTSKINLFPIIALLTVWFLTRTDGILTSFPHNMVVKLGDRVEFECNTNETVPDPTALHTYAVFEPSPLDWTFLSASSSTEEFIYRGGYVLQNFSSKYTIISDTKEGKHNLVIYSVDLSFAGTYKCIEPAHGDKQIHIVSAELIVIVGSSTTHTPALNDGLHVCAIIGIVLGGMILSIAIIVAIIYKLRKRDNLVIPRSTDETSSETKEHEMTAKLIRQMGDSISSPVHLSTSNEEGRENQSEDNIGHEVYSSLQRDQSDSFAQRDVYAKLQIYANTNFKET